MRLKPALRFSLAVAAFLLGGLRGEARHRVRHIAPYGCCNYAPDSDPFDTDLPPIVHRPDLPPSFVVPPGEGPESEPSFVPEGSPRPETAAPYPQGFVLDVPVPRNTDGRAGSRPNVTLSRYKQVADALAACWAPPATFDDRPWTTVTLRVSFKRDGTVNGEPRVPYVDQGLTGPARSGLTASLMDALRRCTPLPFSPSLGGAVAGQVFALRFIEQDQN